MTTTNNNIIILNGITFTYNIIDISKIDKWNNTRFKYIIHKRIFQIKNKRSINIKQT